MNCKKVEELLPLYVGHDLEDEPAGLINEHVRTCTQCARSAEEFVGAGQLLQRFAAPEFSDATYAAIRENVLREIEQKSGTWSWRELLLGPFQPRLRWAVSTAVLLAVCAFAYYFVANRTNRPPDPQANAGIKLAPGGAAGGRTSTEKVQPELVRVHPTPVRESHRPRLNLTALAQRHSTKSGVTTVGPVNAVQYSPEEPKIEPFNTAATSRKPMRLEIQTSDPNIRIIWFSQPSTNEGSPNESSKGI